MVGQTEGNFRLNQTNLIYRLQVLYISAKPLFHILFVKNNPPTALTSNSLRCLLQISINIGGNLASSIGLLQASLVKDASIYHSTSDQLNNEISVRIRHRRCR